MDHFLEKMGVDFWMRVLAFIKIRESNKNINKKQYESILDDAKQIFSSTQELRRSVAYIDSKIESLVSLPMSRKPNINFR